MEWTTELRYKRYEDWTEEEKKQIKRKTWLILLGILITMSNPKLAF